MSRIPKAPNHDSEEALIAAAREQMMANIPPKRSFKVLRQARDESQPGSLFSIIGRYEWVVIEAHSYNVPDCGSLAFFVQEFCEKGMQGMGVYSRCVSSLAPGTWLEVLEITESMQLRPAAIN